MRLSQNIWDDKNLIKTLRGGGVVVMPTDTIYGIVGNAQDASTVERVYKTRKRAPERPCIVLISDINELKKFAVTLSEKQKSAIENFSVPTSFILKCGDEKLAYLHRGTKTLAFRLPYLPMLQELLLKTGPLIAPSANTEGLPPAKNIPEAQKYFGNQIDLYIDGGKINNRHSKLVRLNEDGSIFVLRN